MKEKGVSLTIAMVIAAIITIAAICGYYLVAASSEKHAVIETQV